MTPADNNQSQQRENIAPYPVPPKMLTVLTLAVSGSSWDDAAAAVGLKEATLRRWLRTAPRCQELIEMVVRENINTANNILSNTLPRLADELLSIAIHISTKPYSRIAAISEAFQVVNTNVLEAEQRKQLQAIQSHLDSLEDGSAQVVDIKTEDP